MCILLDPLYLKNVALQFSQSLHPSKFQVLYSYHDIISILLMLNLEFLYFRVRVVVMVPLNMVLRMCHIVPTTFNKHMYRDNNSIRTWKTRYQTTFLNFATIVFLTNVKLFNLFRKFWQEIQELNIDLHLVCYPFSCYVCNSIPTTLEE